MPDINANVATPQTPEPPKDPIAIRAEIDAKFNTVERAWKKQQMRMYKNIAFLIGKQYVFTDVANAKLIDVLTLTRNKKKVRMVINKIQPTIRILLSKLLRVQPILTAEANTEETEDIQSAKVSDLAFNWAWQHLLVEKQKIEWLTWMLTCGVAYMQPYFNPSAGKSWEDNVMTPNPTPLPVMGPNPQDPTQQIQSQMNGQPQFFEPMSDPNNPDQVIPLVKKFHLGDINNMVLSPFEVYPDNISSDDLRDCRFVFKVKTVSPDYVMDLYGVEVKGSTKKATGIEAQLMSLYGGESQDIENAVTLKEYYEKPTNKYPNGRMYVYTDDKLIDIGTDELPEEYRDEQDWCPIVKFDASAFPPGRLIKMGLIELLEPLQKQINVEHSSLVKTLAQGPKYFVPEGADIDEDKLTKEDNERIDYNASAGTPTAVSPPARGADIWRHLNDLYNQWMELSGQHEVSHSNIPKGVKSGNAIAYLQEQDDNQMAPTLSLMGISISRWGKKCLRIMQKHFNEERIIKLIGRDNKTMAIKFLGANINLDCDLKVEMTSAMPRSEAARKQELLGMAQAGWLRPDQYMKMAHIKDTEHVWKPIELQEQRAKWENDEMQQGIVHYPQDFDNNQIHLEIHNEVRLLPEFSKMDPKIVAIITEHCKIHQQIIIQQQQQQMAMQMAAKPQPPQPPQKGQA